MSRFFSEALGGHDRSGFSSGHERIDRYFQEVVTQDVKRRYAGCFVLVERDSGQVAGFYTLSACSVRLADVPEALARKLPRYPSVLIGWMGRDQRFRGQRLGELLLADALTRVVRSPVGAHALCADAIDDAAAAFYVRHQFTPLPSRPGCFFLPVKTAQQLFNSDEAP